LDLVVRDFDSPTPPRFPTALLPPLHSSLLPPPAEALPCLSMGAHKQSCTQQEESYLTFVFEPFVPLYICGFPVSTITHLKFVLSLSSLHLTGSYVLTFVLTGSRHWMTGLLHHQLNIRDSDGSLGPLAFSF